MDILQIGTEILKKSLAGQGSTDSEVISKVLSKLIGGGDSLNIGDLVSSLQSGGLASIATSWLGDGDNKEIPKSQISDLLGSDKIADAANDLGTDQDSLLSGLSQALPEMVNSASSGGSLLDAVGGVGGALDMAKKFF